MDFSLTKSCGRFLSRISDLLFELCKTNFTVSLVNQSHCEDIQKCIRNVQAGNIFANISFLQDRHILVVVLITVDAVNDSSGHILAVKL